jgi:cation transport ATPase
MRSATPTAVMVATDLAAKRGVLFREAKSLELASRVQAFVFDKNGHAHGGQAPRIANLIAQSVAEDELLRLAAASEARSSHPLAQTALDEADRRGLANDLTVEDFENLAGLGIRAHIRAR